MKTYIDSHLHVLGLGYNETLINLTKFKSIDEVTSIKSNKKMIVGRGWHENDFKEKRSLTKTDLNQISDENPIVFIRVCGHVIVVNDKMMEVANITKDTPQIDGGTFDCETGIFTEDALHLIYQNMPKPTKEDIKEMFINGGKILLKNNITMCASDDFSTLPVHYELVLQAMKEIYAEGKMPVKIIEQVNLPSKNLLDDFISKGYHKINEEMYKMGPLKLLADGSLGGRTAYMNEDYSDDPGNRGVKVFEDDVLNELVYTADRNGMDVNIHAIGDGTVEQVLNAVEYATSKTNRTDHRHSIIHAQCANLAQIQRMKELGVSAIVQPIFLNSDIPIIEERLGERSKESYLFKTMFDEGIVVGFSTDAPVEKVSPEENIEVAMTRQSLKYPELGEFLPNEKFSYNECIKCYTENNLWLLREDE